MSCKRNAFLMLLHADQERALNYLASCLDQVNNFGDILQLVIVELIYKVINFLNNIFIYINVLLTDNRFAMQIPLNVLDSFDAFTIY